MSGSEDGATSTTSSPQSGGDSILRHYFAECAMLAPIEIRDSVPWPAVETVNTSNAPHVLLETVLNDLQRAGVAMTRWNEEDARVGASSLNWMDVDARLVEQQVWQRRLVESLITVVLFSTTPAPAYYHHFLLLMRREEARHEQEERVDFFDGRSERLAKEISAADLEMRALEKADVDLRKCWYLAQGRQTRPQSVRAKLKQALQVATAMERRCFGYCYGIGFSEPSGAVHFNPLPSESDRFEARMKLKFTAIQCGFLVATILVRVQALLGIEVQKRACRFARQVSDASSPGRLTADCGVGDFCVVEVPNHPPYLAEITGKLTCPQFSNESYRVRYLDGSPFGLAADRVMVHEVRPLPLPSRSDARTSLRPRCPGITEDDVDVALDEAVVFAWREAVRDIYLAHRERCRDAAV